MNNEQMQGDLAQFKTQAKQKWPLLSDNDFELYMNGKRQKLADKIQEVYGKTREQTEKEIKELEKNCGCSTSNKAA